MLAQLVSSSPFPLPGATSCLADITTLLRRVMLPSHGAKIFSLPSLHLLTMIHLVASPLKLKPKH
jgi:hypothetical protein